MVTKPLDHALGGGHLVFAGPDGFRIQGQINLRI
jgi:hypothetical protein